MEPVTTTDMVHWPVVLCKDGEPIGIFDEIKYAFDHAGELDKFVFDNKWFPVKTTINPHVPGHWVQVSPFGTYTVRVVQDFRK